VRFGWRRKDWDKNSRWKRVIFGEGAVGGNEPRIKTAAMEDHFVLFRGGGGGGPRENEREKATGFLLQRNRWAGKLKNSVGERNYTHLEKRRGEVFG